MIFETHAHYDDEAFDGDREAVLEEIHANGVDYIVNCGANLRTSKQSIELAESHDYIYAAAGVHPDDIGDLEGDGLDVIRELASYKKCLAIGEIGLDYHWDKFPRDKQREGFVRQWELAIELDKPIEIHSRDAAADTFDIVRDMYEKEKAKGRALRADMHCYSYSLEQALEYEKMGLYFGVGGVVTFKNAKKLHEVVRAIPLTRILLETDCPYLAPEPFRGSRNNSGYITRVVEKLAELKEVSAEEVYAVTMQNAKTFFGL